MSDGKRVGDINGSGALLFRIANILTPILLLVVSAGFGVIWSKLSESEKSIGELKTNVAVIKETTAKVTDVHQLGLAVNSRIGPVENRVNLIESRVMNPASVLPGALTAIDRHVDRYHDGG